MDGRLGFSEAKEVVRFVSENGVRILNLCHVPEDGRLKTLSFSAVGEKRVREILEVGERVDGSSLFSFIEPGKSDIYVMPRPGKAFMSPFAAWPTLNVLCDYLDENGKPLNVAPSSVLARAEEKLSSKNNVVLKALAELEFYVFSKPETAVLFPGAPDKNYHESAPFARFEYLRNEILVTLADVGIATKYGHGEVGLILEEDNTVIEQHEVELAPQTLSETADTIAVAKWIIRSVCSKHGVSVSFSPKVAMDHAGTGMHIHLCALKNNENVIANEDGTPSISALKMIGGILRLAPSLAAFGNTTPVSYLRFIARKESPMHICWSARNRLALVRIPLWWTFAGKSKDNCRVTFEYRAPDAFSNAHLLFAGLVLAAKYGLENSEEALKIAKDLHIEADDDTRGELKMLPCSCSESADNLEKDRWSYEADGVFPAGMIDKITEKLRSYGDKNLWKNLAGQPDEASKFLKRYLHYG